jgi:hypothetical protein
MAAVLNSYQTQRLANHTPAWWRSPSCKAAVLIQLQTRITHNHVTLLRGLTSRRMQAVTKLPLAQIFDY